MKKKRPSAVSEIGTTEEGRSSYNKDVYDTYLKERNSLVNALLDQSRSFDKHVLTLAAGTFGLSLAFIREIAPIPRPDTMAILGWAWGAFAASILLTLVSFLFSQEACLRQIQILESKWLEQQQDKGGMVSTLTKVTRYLNWVSWISFSVGVIMLIVFSMWNLTVPRGG